MAPAASFKASRISGYAPLDVNFANNSRKATSYLWSFGDSSPSSSEVSPSHTFTSPGKYTITLNASSLAGSTTKSVTINVLPARPDLSLKLVRKTSKSTGRLRLTSFSATLGDKGGAHDHIVPDRYLRIYSGVCSELRIRANSQSSPGAEVAVLLDDDTVAALGENPTDQHSTEQVSELPSRSRLRR